MSSSSEESSTDSSVTSRIISNSDILEANNKNEDKPKDTKYEPNSQFSLKIFGFGSTMDIFLTVIGCLAFTGQGVMFPMFSYIFGDLVKDLGSDATAYIGYIKLLASLGGVAMILGFIGASQLESIAELRVRLLKKAFISSITRQEIAYFDENEPETISTKLNQNVVFIREGTGMKFGQIFQFTSQFLSGYTLAIIANWELALVLTSVIPLIGLSAFLFMRLMFKRQEISKKVMESAGGVAEETFQSIRTVVAFGGEERQIAKFDEHVNKSESESLRGALYFGLGLGNMMFVMFCSYALGFWYSGKMVADDLREDWTNPERFEGGDAIRVFFCIIIAAFSLGQIGAPMTAFLKAGGATADLLNLTTRESKIDPSDPSGYKDQDKLEGEIEFKEVSFAFPTRLTFPVYDKISIKIKAGEKVAFVGASGCGKSTAIQLLERFYDISDGEILVDGKNIKDYNLQYYRRNISLVSQEPRLFTRSIAANIGQGKPNATKEEIIDAAKRANAHNFIMDFPDQYETHVGQGGSQLSGGQKQRIAIARAIIGNPSILILDEATSALDNESEKIVQDTLNKVMETQKCTTIMIAHRLSTIRQADNIFVFVNDGDGSRVKESGTHEELMNLQNGVYQNLVDLQKLDEPENRKKRERIQSVEGLVSAYGSKKQSFCKKESKIADKPIEIQPKKKKTTKKICGKKQIEEDDEDMGEHNYKEVSQLRIWKMFGPVWGKITLAFIGSIVNGLIMPSFAFILSEFIGVLSVYPISEDDALIKADEIEKSSSMWALAFVGVAVTAFFSNLLQQSMFTYSGLFVVHNLQKNAFTSIVYQDISFFDDPKNSTGDLSSAITAEVVLIKSWVAENTGLMIQSAASLILGATIAFMASPKLAAVTLAAFATIIPASFIQMRILRGEKKYDRWESEGYVLHETLSGIRTVAAFSLQEEIVKEFETVAHKGYVEGRKEAYILGFFWGFTQFLTFGAQSLAFWYAGELVTRGEIPINQIEQIMKAIFALLFAAMGTGQASSFMTDTAKAKKAAKRVFYMIDRNSPIDARDPSGKVGSVDQQIEMQNVAFVYPQRKDVTIFKNLDLKILAGQTTALVGPSGCGKSTIIQLLERFYDTMPDSEKPSDFLDKSNAPSLLSIDGIEIKDWNIKQLRSQIALVSQEPQLFNSTIKDNIRFGKYDATDDEIITAAKKSNAHNFIMEFPDGYDTKAGSLGGQLSGGQKQRICIARAIVRRPKLLLLDEATSALDAESERVVQDALDELLKESDFATIVIAHRLSTIKNASKIMVLTNPHKEGSSVVESGTHDELMNIPGGVYNQLVAIVSSGGDIR
eukprot:GHVP01067800.1.p1 GENE.GHVP01067800.1~~GHVP01067800.1.p1  ORF type:complete len:1342 (-),score=300.08 GHVP01067800.1:581-4555(-)